MRFSASQDIGRGKKTISGKHFPLNKIDPYQLTEISLFLFKLTTSHLVGKI